MLTNQELTALLNRAAAMLQCQAEGEKPKPEDLDKLVADLLVEAMMRQTGR